MGFPSASMTSVTAIASMNSSSNALIAWRVPTVHFTAQRGQHKHNS